MNSPRNLLKKGLSIFASLLAESRIKNLGIVTVFCPFYHLVSDEDAPHIRHLYPIKSIADFKEELRLFKEHFEFVSLAEMKEGIELGVKPKCFLSFDDGLKQVYQEIVPILKEENIPATFFINPLFEVFHNIDNSPTANKHIVVLENRLMPLPNVYLFYQ